jgi:hypothetical protein
VVGFLEVEIQDFGPAADPVGGVTQVVPLEPQPTRSVV